MRANSVTTHCRYGVHPRPPYVWAHVLLALLRAALSYARIGVSRPSSARNPFASQARSARHRCIPAFHGPSLCSAHPEHLCGRLACPPRLAVWIRLSRGGQFREILAVSAPVGVRPIPRILARRIARESTRMAGAGFFQGRLFGGHRPDGRRFGWHPASATLRARRTYLA